MKKITLNATMTALRTNASAEPEGSRIVYYLHLTEDGKIVQSVQDADETFTASADMEEYFGDRADDDDWGAMCADAEADPASGFQAICQDLADQANAWLASL